MPVIRVEVPAGTPAGTQQSIRTAVEAAVLEALAPKETRYDGVAAREVVAEIGDGVPLVEIDLRPGREPERKEAPVDAIAEILNVTMGVEAADVQVLFREDPAENHYCGGTPLPLDSRRRMAAGDAANPDGATSGTRSTCRSRAAVGQGGSTATRTRRPRPAPRLLERPGD